jgi:hypothetical protein
MKKQKRGIVPESHLTEHLIAVGIAIVVVLLVVMFTSCTTVQREKIIDMIDGLKPLPTATPEPDHEAPVEDNLRVIKGGRWSKRPSHQTASCLSNREH